MSWTRFKIIFRLCSPLHIGLQKTGNLKMTRGYVPGRVIWGAMTARLVRDHDPSNDYDKIGNLLKDKFCFDYFYPALKKEGVSSEVTPENLETIFEWKEEHFGNRFISSYVSSAIDYSQNTTLEGALHETEFIRPYTRPLGNSAPKPVYLIGDIFVQQPFPDNDILKYWEECLPRLQIGSERRYGWGKLGLEYCAKEETRDEPTIKVKKGDFIKRHALIDGVEDILFGVVEPITGWRQTEIKNGSAWRLRKPLLCFAPNSKVMETTTFTIDSFGQLSKRDSAK